MSVSSTVKIGGELVDISKPCDVALALKKVRLSIATGGSAQTVKMNGEEVTFSRANLAALNGLISDYEKACTEASGGTVRRRARRVRWA